MNSLYTLNKAMASWHRLLILSVVFSISLPFLHAEKVTGELDIPKVSPLNGNQLIRLRSLVDEDPEAMALVKIEEEASQPFLKREPQPIREIHYEGLVNTDPRRIATVEKLEDMARFATLLRLWQATGDTTVAAALRRYILAWTGTYRITGNDVNENKLYPLLCAYEALRDTFSETEQETIDGWVREFGKRHAKAVEKSDHLTNRYAKHVRLTAVCGMILDKPEWVELAFSGIRRFVTESLRPDGTSIDLERRDSLTYHASALRPMIELAMITAEHGRELYTWESEAGGSIKKSVDYLVPFALGGKTRKEWVNSKVGLDHRRSEAGIEKYRAGRLYDPMDALKVMQEACFFDPDLNRVVRHLRGDESGQYSSWQSLVNKVARPRPVASLGKEIISTKADTWRSATVFTHIIWRDLLFFGGGSGSDGGDPRHEMEIGVFHLTSPDSGYFDERNPIITRKQFDLDQPGKGITPLSMVESGDRLFLFCTARPDDDLHPRIVVIEASVDDPFTWKNLTVVIDQDLSGEINNHGASALVNPDDPTELLLYFAALTPPKDYRILLAKVPLAQVMDPTAYRLEKGYDEPVLQRENGKTNYPAIRYDEKREEYELWYSGHSLDNLATRSSFRTVSKKFDFFAPAKTAVIDPSGDLTRNDCSYATGPKFHDGWLYYSGRREARGDYRGIFVVPPESSN